MKREIKFRPAFDWRHPDPKQNYGIGSLTIWFYVHGPKATVQWHVNTQWYLKANREANGDTFLKYPFEPNKPDGWDLGYHADSPQYEGQGYHKCDCRPSGRCYYDGTSLGAKELEEGFLAGGADWVFEKLEKYYDYRFENGPPVDFSPEYQPHPKARS